MLSMCRRYGSDFAKKKDLGPERQTWVARVCPGTFKEPIVDDSEDKKKIKKALKEVKLEKNREKF